MKRNTEKVLTRINLKYYHKPKKTDKENPSGITCAWCFEKDITNIGGGYRDDKGKVYQICEECATLRYKQDFGFKTIKATRARRRRIFDVGYLFNEMLIDIYMNSNNILDFKDFNKADDLFIKASELYNILFSKEDKIRLEEIEDQYSIVNELQKRLLVVDLSKFFEQLQ